MKIAILGSTGSIGTQTLDVVRSHPELIQVELLTAASNWELLAQQAIEFQPSTVVISDERHYTALCQALANQPIHVWAGSQAIIEAIDNSLIDTVVSAIVGFAGLAPTIAAIKAGKKIALANKESLVVAGSLVMQLAHSNNVPIIPIDSEHSAIFQCLVGENSPASRVIITASGGALRDMTPQQLQHVTPEQALKHPNWSMGAKITIDSATMVNKGFEVIEAGWLFGLRADQIDVVIHRESIIHSFVEFHDRAIKAQMGCPDMRMPIQYALTFPARLPMPQLEQYNPLQPLTFSEVDPQQYPCLALAYQAMRSGGGMACIMNAANEIAVAAFLNGTIPYTSIYSVLDQTLQSIANSPIDTLEQIIALDTAARHKASNLVTKI